MRRLLFFLVDTFSVFYEATIMYSYGYMLFIFLGV